MPKAAFSAILLTGALGSLAGCHQHHEEQKTVALPLPPGTPKRPHGLLAIKATPGSPQPFTKSDVVTYFTTHNLSMSSGPVGQIHVDSLQFLTSKQVGERLQGVSTGLPDGDLIGFVTLSGTFVVSGPPRTKPATFSTAYAAFDGATGNLLMDGTLDSGKRDNSGVR